MIPYMSLKDRIISWLLWKLNGWETMAECKFECFDHPEFSRMAALCRDRYYAMQAKEAQ